VWNFLRWLYHFLVALFYLCFIYKLIEKKQAFILVANQLFAIMHTLHVYAGSSTLTDISFKSTTLYDKITHPFLDPTLKSRFKKAVGIDNRVQPIFIYQTILKNNDNRRGLNISVLKSTGNITPNPFAITCYLFELGRYGNSENPFQCNVKHNLFAPG
jgi:hypothetical protein